MIIFDMQGIPHEKTFVDRVDFTVSKAYISHDEMLDARRRNWINRNIVSNKGTYTVVFKEVHEEIMESYESGNVIAFHLKEMLSSAKVIRQLYETQFETKAQEILEKVSFDDDILWLLDFIDIASGEDSALWLAHFGDIG